jgi:predicted nucleotidyltransferase
VIIDFGEFDKYLNIALGAVAFGMYILWDIRNSNVDIDIPDDIVCSKCKKKLDNLQYNKRYKEWSYTCSKCGHTGKYKQEEIFDGKSFRDIVKEQKK